MRTPVFKGNVVVSNVPSTMTADDLADLFDQYGLVLGAKIERWHDRPGGAQGMVDLAPDTSVDKAIAALHGSIVGTQKISVRRAPKPAAKPKKASPPRPPMPAPYGVAKESMARPPAPALAFPASAAPVRKVVVEYRTPRRIVLPPRTNRTGEVS
jgi:RNA recognition motif-containing protein